MKNAEIELYRFLMIIGVAVLHFSEDYQVVPFYGGYLGVEFCFILSGYFLMMHFYRNYSQENNPVESSVNYIVDRVKKLYLPYIFAVLVMIFIKWIELGGGVLNLFLLMYDSRWQFLMLHSVGMPMVSVIRSTWYLSPLIILSFFIYFCLGYNKKLYLGLSPIVSLLIFVYMAREFGFFGMHFEYVGIFSGGILRGFSEMSLGVFIAYLVEEYGKNKNIKFTLINGLLIRIICYAVLIYTIFTSHWNFNDYNALPAFAVLIFITFMQPLNIKFSKVFTYLGGISYWIYLIHNIVGHILSKYYIGYNYWWMLTIYLLCVVVLSMILQFVFKKMDNLLKKPQNLKFS